VFRLVASLSDGCARLGTVVIGGMDVGWDNRSRPLNLMGKGGERGEEQNTKNGCSRVRTSYMVLCARNYNPRYFSKNSFSL
jgi:hypothetical protein